MYLLSLQFMAETDLFTSPFWILRSSKKLNQQYGIIGFDNSFIIIIIIIIRLK